MRLWKIKTILFRYDESFAIVTIASPYAFCRKHLQVRVRKSRSNLVMTERPSKKMLFTPYHDGQL